MEFDIVIIGGGLVGASLASALRNTGLRLALIEGQPLPEPDSGWDSRIYAFTPGNADFLKECGAWQRLDLARVQQVEEMRVFGDTGARLNFSAYEIGAPELAFIMESRLLQHALWQGLREQENLTLIQPAQCAEMSLQDDAARLKLKDGREIRAKLIVGADGRDSWARHQTLMPEVPTPYHQHGVVANFSVGKAHRGIAYQWFTPEGILALLPLPGKHISIVWSVSPEHSAELLALTHEEFCARVSAASNHTLGELQVITPPAAFALRVLNLAHLTKHRLALVGDAAHNVHPLSGQGVNLGLRDVRELAKVLQQRGELDCGDLRLLRRYEQARQSDIMSMQLTTDTLKNLFVNDNPLLRTLRNIGLDATNKIVPLKKMLVRHALN
ncbi:UbiH/UbiF family hydroxylase [Sideroxydans lithotrophicus]|uniref:Ubiquinone biosynthesis hydroxylase, UbiH/UbiF/VisC/COQ6 family n=1 Tax=Sideroxydans lithotrophicus (strain ES-1) TaxID=580332 RepID=D5CLE4_SIDLE|nr:UbiH/UbiF family hydroxylase [Sideroxydans lithotrophicus]ADE10532.1 Ubiquinone biosynthesis hydroxylase, UbiH/UbiF/VisC/COQ6 family [Sideroxydans lithotrophicus ES-1]